MSAEALDRVLAELAAWTPGVPVDRRGVGCTDLLISVRRHRLVGVLAAAAATNEIEVDIDEAALIARDHAAAMAEALLLEDVMLGAIGIFERAGVEHRLLKGAALAHTVHPDPSHRSFGDVDLLVRSDDLDRAVGALVEGGARRPVPALSADFDRRFAKSVTLEWRHGTEVDLHRTLAPPPFGLRIVIEDLWGEPIRFELAGFEVSTLSTELHLLNGAYHAVLGDVEPRYGNVRDLALLLAGDLDAETVVELATRWRGDSVLARAIELVRATGAPIGELGEWADRVEVSHTDRRRLEAYARRQGRFRRQAVATLAELRWSDRFAYARALVFPDRAHRRARRGAGRL